MKFFKIVIIVFILFSLSVLIGYFFINIESFTVNTLSWEKVEQEQSLDLSENKTEPVINDDLNKELIKNKIKNKLDIETFPQL